FWVGLAGLALGCFLPGALRTLLFSCALALLIFSFVRAFSRNLPAREAENVLYLRWLDKKKQDRLAKKQRWASRKEYRYFKCPGCGTWLRVPRGKGKIHINCRCGYTLYRRT
ncbi:MAG: hypothetical protein IKO55_17425, partial [Kiritimatiellae bacterium]|nr:hypothetical protein [Kiritimatiellia bacterium]